MKTLYRLRPWEISVCLLAIPALALAQTCPTIPAPPAPPPPSVYQSLYSLLNTDLVNFNTTLSSLWNGSTYPVVFAGNLANANCNVGPSLATAGGTVLQLQALKAMGVQAVLVQVGFPILYQPFYNYLATLSPPPPAAFQNLQYSSFVNYYQQLASNVRAAGLKLILENNVLLSNDVQAGWGPVMPGYYATLDWATFQTARAQDALTTVQVMQPDYMVVLEEPVSQASQTGQPNINTVSGAASLVNTILTTLGPVRSSVKVGAGVANDQQSFQSFVQSFAGVQCSVSQPCVNPPGLDFMDMHIYPINNLGGSNNNFLQNALTIASIAITAGKPLAMTEAWMWKMNDAEWPNPNISAIRGRNPFSFWAPLDTMFLQTMENLANYTHMLFMTPEGPDYFWAYQDYNSVTAGETPQQILNAELTLAGQANQVAAYTTTGLSYYCSLVSPADTIPPSTPTLVNTSSGGPTQASLSWTNSTDNVGVAGYYVFRNGVQIYTTGQPLYQDTGLAPATTYTYEIRAFDIAGSVAPAMIATITTRSDTTAPSAPANLAASATGGQVSLTWTASTDNVGVVGYKVYRNGGLIGGSTTTSYQDSGLAANTTYTYTVAAFDSSANTSAQSAPASVTTGADTQPPTVPANLAAQAVSSTQINLSWTASTDNFVVAGYNVYRNGSIVGASTTTTYQDTGLTPSTNYSYKLSAFDAAGNTSAVSADVLATTLPDTSAPSVPKTLTTQAVSSTQINLSWTASTDSDSPVAGYNVYRNGSLAGTAAGTNFQDTGLQPSTSYSYTASAYDPAGNTSAQSTAVSATTLPDTSAPTAPANLAAQAVSPNQINLSWTASTDSDSPVSTYYVYRNGTQVGASTTTSYQDTGLIANTTYSYKVSAADPAGNTSAQSTAVSATTQPDTTPPSAPTNLAATVVSSAQINLSWNASTDSDSPVAGYNVYRNGSKVGASISTSYQDSGLTPSTTYSYTVSAYDPAGNTSAQSTAVSATTPADSTPPSVPANVTAQGASSTQINLAWTASTDPDSSVAGYNIYRNGSMVGTSAGTSYQDTGLTPSTSYSYTVSGYDPAGNTSAQSTVVSGSTKPDTSPPTAPTNLTASAASSTQINLSWAASTDSDSPVAGYNVYRNGSKVGTAASTSYQDTGLTPNTTYNYAVSAYDPAGNTSAQSSAASGTTQPDTSPPTVPANLAAQATSATQISLSWIASTDPDSAVSGYNVYRNGSKIGTALTASYQDTGLTPNTTYSYTVSAYDPAGNTSAQSAASSATTPADNTPPSVPANLTATVISFTQVNLSWTASTDPDSAIAGYNIYRNGGKVATTGATTYQDGGLTPDTTYTYTVSAYDPSGNTSAQSSPASATPLDAPPSVPTGLSATAVSSNVVNLTWLPSTDSVGVAGYKIYRGTSPGSLSQLATSPIPSYSDSTVAGFTTYYYAVAAYDAIGTTSGQSSQVSVKTPDTIPPAVVITAPISGAVITGNPHLTITATATDAISGVANVQFLIDGTNVGTVTSAPYTISYFTKSLNSGTHTIKAIAVDNAGNSATSAPVTFILQ